MDISIYLARVFGIYLVITCLSILINKKHLLKILHDFSNNLGLVVFTGLIHLFLGLLIVIAHNVWAFDFRGVVTFIGWVGVVKGGLRLLAPTKVTRLGEEFTGGKKLIAWGIFWFIIGLYLICKGFF